MSLKGQLSSLLTPIFRIANPRLDKLKQFQSFVLLASRVRYPLDPSVIVMGATEVRGTGNIKLGRNLLLFPGGYLETRGEGSIGIGDDVVFSRGVHVVSYARISIGAGTMIGEYSSVRDANHSRDGDGSMRDGDHFASPITIGRNVWIGRGVTILPGVSIGDHATVAANAVVTRDVIAGVTVAGVPAVALRSASSGAGKN
jgi:acetyltransferase-like isoleucine patch superfamily enzyme